MKTAFKTANPLLSLILIAGFFFAYPQRLQAQAANEVAVAVPLKLASQPLPGQDFDVLKHAPMAAGGSTSVKHITFSKAQVGKIKNATLILDLEGTKVAASTLRVEGPKAAKRLRKYLRKTYGSPTYLTVQEGKERLSWHPEKNARYTLTSESDTADTFCSATLQKR